jgi:hypothetical protein
VRTHIFIDFENVQPPPEEFARVPHANVHVWLLHGAHQHDFSSALVRTWLPLGDRMQLVQSTKTGENAVDMVLAYCLGRAVEQDRHAARQARYVIVSNDKDFNALTTYLKQTGTRLERAPTLAKALEAGKPAPKPKAVATVRSVMKSDDAATVSEHLRNHEKTQPTTRTKLERSIPSMLGEGVTLDVCKSVVSELERRGRRLLVW